MTLLTVSLTAEQAPVISDAGAPALPAQKPQDASAVAAFQNALSGQPSTPASPTPPQPGAQPGSLSEFNSLVRSRWTHGRERDERDAQPDEPPVQAAVPLPVATPTPPAASNERAGSDSTAQRSIGSVAAVNAPMTSASPEVGSNPAPATLRPAEPVAALRVLSSPAAQVGVPLAADKSPEGVPDPLMPRAQEPLAEVSGTEQTERAPAALFNVPQSPAQPVQPLVPPAVQQTALQSVQQPAQPSATQDAPGFSPNNGQGLQRGSAPARAVSPADTGEPKPARVMAPSPAVQPHAALAEAVPGAGPNQPLSSVNPQPPAQAQDAVLAEAPMKDREEEELLPTLAAHAVHADDGVTATPVASAAPSDTGPLARTDLQAVRDLVAQVRRTLGQRDLESLDAGRKVVVSLPQGDLPVQRLELTGDGQGGLAAMTLVASSVSGEQSLSSRSADLSSVLRQDNPALRLEVRAEVSPVATEAPASGTMSGGSGQDRQGSQQPSRDDVAQALDRIQQRAPAMTATEWLAASQDFERRLVTDQ